MNTHDPKADRSQLVELRLGREELIISRVYEVASIANDFLIALWFIVGSICFLMPAWVETGSWIFLIGSIQLAIRPAIRLTRHIHLKKLPPGHRYW